MSSPRRSSMRHLLGLALVLCAPLASPEAGWAQERRVTPSEFDFNTAGGAGAGTSGVQGIRTVILTGDPTQPGLYTIMLKVPPHTRIAAHTHADARIATVVSGVWRLGYGGQWDETKLKALPPGSFYTEPAGEAHFAQTRDTEVIVQITGYGPTDTHYVEPKSGQ